jgi:hypothetical protein
MTVPLPDLKLLSRRDPEFTPQEVTQEEFEQVWATRQFKSADPM